MITTFLDMHSGGSRKEEYGLIAIEAPRDEAELIFYNRFGHNPNRVTCTCCGPDYSISELGSHDDYIEAYGDCHGLLIRESEIKPEERTGELPEQGYVWKD